MVFSFVQCSCPVGPDLAVLALWRDTSADRAIQHTKLPSVKLLLNKLLIYFTAHLFVRADRPAVVPITATDPPVTAVRAAQEPLCR